MKTKYIMKIMNVIFWIVFIGLCIKTGSITISFIISLFVNPEASNNLYLGLDLSNVYNFDIRYYVGIVTLMIGLVGSKAYIAYLVVKLFIKFDITNPFNEIVVSLISKIGYVALSIGILALIANDYSKLLIKKGVEVQFDWGAQEFLFFAGIIYIIALVFKKGVEIQNENELTI